MTNDNSIKTPRMVLISIVFAILAIVGIIAFSIRGCKKPPGGRNGETNGGQSQNDGTKDGETFGRGTTKGGEPQVGGNDNGDGKPTEGDEQELVPPPWKRTRTAAYDLQTERNWCDAKKKWGELLDELSVDTDEETESSIAAVREEAERNERLCAKRCQPPKPLVAEREIPRPERLPEKISERDLVAANPKGREVRGIAYLFIDGQGTNNAWVFRQSVSFHYQYRVRVKTLVKQNRGTAIVFDQHFTDVDELRAISKHELEFAWPKSSILDVVTAETDRRFSQIPQYVVLKAAAGAWSAIDPGGKRTLSRLQRFIPGLNNVQDAEIVQRLKDLDGQRLELEYVSGLGVTEIKVLDGEKLDPDLLDHLARGSTVMMDYFVDRAVKKDSPEFDLDTKDVGDMFNLGDEGRVTGAIHLERGETDDAGQLELNITGGALKVEIDEEGAAQQSLVTPKSGEMHYSEKEQLVTDARCAWHADTLWATTDHLLFGTSAVRDLAIRTYYEAELISAGEKPTAAKAPDE